MGGGHYYTCAGVLTSHRVGRLKTISEQNLSHGRHVVRGGLPIIVDLTPATLPLIERHGSDGYKSNDGGVPLVGSETNGGINTTTASSTRKPYSNNEDMMGMDFPGSCGKQQRN
jgi:hypothetical protein